MDRGALWATLVCDLRQVTSPMLLQDEHIDFHTIVTEKHEGDS